MLFTEYSTGLCHTGGTAPFLFFVVCALAKHESPSSPLPHKGLEILIPGLAHQSLLLHVVEQVYEWLPKVVVAEQIGCFLVIAYCGRGHHRKYLVQSAYASWQRHKHIALCHHQCLAVVQVVTGYMYIHVLAQSASLFHLGRHHPYGVPTVALGSSSHALHQSCVASAIHNGVSFFCRPSSQSLGQCPVFFGHVVIGRTEYAYLHFCKIVG